MNTAARPSVRPPASLPGLIEEIRAVYLFERKVAGEKFVSYSPPGHILHLVTRGQVYQHCNGREYRLRRGDMLWYHESELVEGMCERTPWRFYSVVFHAPALPPPDFAQRLTRPAMDKIEPLFARLFRAWHQPGDDVRRAFRCHAALNEILLFHRTAPSAAPRPAPERWLGNLWWSIETQVRQNLGRGYPLAELAALGHASPATVHRASLAAVGEPPVRRIKRLRLELARGLLIYSRAPIKEIAEKTGYDRVNELSRDFRKAFHATPSAFRRRAGLTR